MDKVNLPFFYQLGYYLHTLTVCSAIPSDRLRILRTSTAVHSYLKNLLSSVGALTVCRSPGNNLISNIDKVHNWWKNTARDKIEQEDISADIMFGNVINSAKILDTVLTSELQILVAYWATQKGIYSTTDLIEKTENIFPVTVLHKLNKAIIEEVRECGKCLAFDNATASAFHIIRAIELVIHIYYISVFELDPKTTERLENWGAYITELKKSTDSSVKEVVAILQQMKDLHRNLIMHPEVVLNPDEAFILFEIAKSSIIAMSDKLPSPKITKK